LRHIFNIEDFAVCSLKSSHNLFKACYFTKISILYGQQQSPFQKSSFKYKFKIMRKPIEQQLKIGEMDIGSIEFDPRSRDEIPKLLRGLQHIYCTPELNEKVFAILKDIVPEGTDSNNGRPGMELWKILVLGTIRLNCNWDYDKLKEIADNHRTLRQMLGHGFDDDDKTYPIQTLKDNVSLLTPEILDRINEVAVSAGHRLVGKKKEQGLNARCDSFVVETDVHFPTDISLLFDAIRKVIKLTAHTCIQGNISGWRQSDYWIKKVKRARHLIQKLKRSTSKNEHKIAKRDQEIKTACQSYLSMAESLLERARSSLKVLRNKNIDKEKTILVIESYIAHVERQIEQTQRRMILGKTIPHSEKVFSVFEPHTEWIVKGKAGISQELGLRVCIVEDQYGFILNHRVMQHETDVDIAVSITEDTVSKYPNISSCSYDKGFHSPDNQVDLGKILDYVVLPKKGRLSVRDRAREHSDKFLALRRQHSAVESAINALENHGLDRCPDHGIDGFNRYVSLAIIGRNLQRIGDILQQRERKHRKRLAA